MDKTKQKSEQKFPGCLRLVTSSWGDTRLAITDFETEYAKKFPPANESFVSFANRMTFFGVASDVLRIDIPGGIRRRCKKTTEK